MPQAVAIYCAGCRRKLTEGDGSTFTVKCPNCKSTTTVEVGRRLSRIASHVALKAQSQARPGDTQ